MIIRRQHKLEFLRRYLPFLRKPVPSGLATKLSLRSAEFAGLIRKEQARCERRGPQAEFSLVTMDFPPAESTGASDQLLIALQDRLRITDELGWLHDMPSVLLPETGRLGAGEVANWIESTARSLNIQVETEVFVYPWDDRVASGSLEIHSGREPIGASVDSGAPPSGSPTADEPPSMRNEEQGDATTNRDNVNQLIVARSGGSFGATFEHHCHAAEPTPLWKRCMDVMGSMAGLLLLSPVFAAAAILIKLDSRGPIFFTQLREGKDGRVFRMYKFRTMRPGAESQKAQLQQYNEQDGPAFKIEADPRVTPIGRLLRQMCIDELPQLVNVLRGEMSLVGPRPLPLDESYCCRMWQRRRLLVAPGLTCIWQVSGGRKVTFERWMRMDLQYSRQRSLALDLKLLAKTVMLVIGQRGSV